MWKIRFHISMIPKTGLMPGPFTLTTKKSSGECDPGYMRPARMFFRTDLLVTRYIYRTRILIYIPICVIIWKRYPRSLSAGFLHWAKPRKADLKQLGLASHFYADDFEGRTVCSYNSSNGDTWDVVLFENSYVKNKNLYACPGDDIPRSGNNLKRSYRANREIFPRIPDDSDVCISHVKRPSEIFVLVDYFVDWNYYSSTSGPYISYGGDMILDARHNTGWNLLFCDGHAGFHPGTVLLGTTCRYTD